MITSKLLISLLAFSIISDVHGSHRGNKRQRGKQRGGDSLSKVTFDASCKIACHGKFCMPAFAMCKYMKGLHPCCGGKSPKSSEPTRSPPLAPPPPSPSSQFTPSPINCKQITGGEYCIFHPKHPCCKSSPVPRTPPPKICLFGTCILKPKIKFEFPSCRILEPPKFGEVTLTTKLYCKFLNTKHKCCKRLNRGKNPAGKPYLKPIRTPKRQVSLKTPDIPTTKHTKNLPPPEAPSPPEGCFGNLLKQTKSSLQMKNLRSRDKRREINGGANDDPSSMENSGMEIPSESLSDWDFCEIEPTHRCCITNYTGTPPVPPPPGVKPDMVIIPSATNSTFSTMKSGFTCDDFTYNLNYCRTNKMCAVNCADRTCRKISEIPNKCTTDCSSNCEDICSCKRSGCQYDFYSKNCRPLKVCLEENFVHHQECRRPSAHYSLGGEMCLNSGIDSNGECSIDYVVLAVNLGGGQRFIDSRGIAYQADKEVEYEDKQDIRKIGTSPKVLGVKEQDVELYQSFIYGATESRGRNRCVVYKVPICEDGLYELSVRTLDNYHNYKGKRLFNVEFNGYTIFPEVDIFALSQATYKAVDLTLNFLVLNGASVMHLSNRKTHRLPIFDDEISLKFCYSGCNKIEDSNFIVSAFSVVKFKGIGDKSNTEEDNKCKQLHFDMCGCKKSGCEYDAFKGTCMEGKQVCGKNDKTNSLSNKCNKVSSKPDLTRIESAGPYCRRTGVYYANGGSVCLNEQTLDECKVEEVVIAVNINGDDVVDEKGIKFKQEQAEMYNDPLGTRVDVVGACFDEKTSDSMKSRTFPLAEVPLYSDMIVGSPKQREVGRCISYPIPGNLQKDGKYELGMKFVEYEHAQSKRFFNVRFADILVLPEFDILSYTQKCTGIDVIVPFEVNGNGTKLNVLGHPDKAIGEDRIELSFCYGECALDENYVYPDYLVGAFYVAKISA